LFMVFQHKFTFEFFGVKFLILWDVFQSPCHAYLKNIGFFRFSMFSSSLLLSIESDTKTFSLIMLFYVNSRLVNKSKILPIEDSDRLLSSYWWFPKRAITNFNRLINYSVMF
jgi:hypothetical protein